MYIQYGRFTIDHNREEVYLEGHYTIDSIIYSKPDFAHRIDSPHMSTQTFFHKSNILVRTNTPDVMDLVYLFAKYTFVPCSDLNLDVTVAHSEEWILGRRLRGSYRPTKETLFAYKSKIFVAYGRCIFGYGRKFALFQRQGVNTIYNVKMNKITKDAIKLQVPLLDNQCFTSFVYAFMIYDSQTNIVDAFGLYR